VGSDDDGGCYDHSLPPYSPHDSLEIPTDAIRLSHGLRSGQLPFREAHTCTYFSGTCQASSFKDELAFNNADIVSLSRQEQHKRLKVTTI